MTAGEGGPESSPSASTWTGLASDHADSGDLETSVKVLRDCYDSLVTDQARLKEMNAYLEQRVRSLEKRLLVDLPEPTMGQPTVKQSSAAVAPSETLAVVDAAEKPGAEEPEKPAEDADDGLGEYGWEESIWDAAIFIGTEQQGAWASLLVGLAVLMNICIQGVFVLIIMQNLVTEEFSQEDLDGLRAWRYKIGHDSRFVSGQNGYSLVERVCAEDGTLEMATEQVRQLDLIRSYLPGKDKGMAHYLQGWLMCILAMMVWNMCIMIEVSNTFDLLGAVRMVPTAKVVTTIVDNGQGGHELRCISWPRRLWAFCIGLMRLTVAGLLLWSGTLYLCYTTSMADLFLNAMALALVMDIDELIFKSMAPVGATELVGSLAPLPMRRWPRWRGADLKAIIAPLFLGGLLVAGWFSGLKVTIQNLKQAEEELCGGNTTFTFNYDGLEMVHATNQQTFDSETAYNVQDIASQAVKEVRDGVAAGSWQYALYSTSYGDSQRLMSTEKLQTMLATVLDIYQRRGSVCHDALDTFPYTPNEVINNQWRAWPQYMERHLGLSSPVTSCAQIRHLCKWSPDMSHLGMAMVRALCPVTCGCDSLLTGSMIVPMEFGCPEVCVSKPNRNERQRTQCTDTTPEDPRSESIVSFVQELALAQPAYNTTGSFLAYGCDFVSRVTVADLCMPSTDDSFLTTIQQGDPLMYQVLKVLTFACPVQCNCGGRRNPSAPRPPDWACPTDCLCEWEMGRTIPEADMEPNCIIRDPFRPVGASMPGFPTDARCCYLLGQFATLFALMYQAAVDGQHVTAYLDVRSDMSLFVMIQFHLCLPCRTGCADIAKNLTANRTLPNGMDPISEFLCRFPTTTTTVTTSSATTTTTSALLTR